MLEHLQPSAQAEFAPTSLSDHQEPSLADLRRETFTRTLDATTFILQAIKFPMKKRGVIDALQGASCGRDAEFELSHLSFAARLGLQEKEVETQRKTVSRELDWLEAWQAKNGVLLFSITRGGGIGKEKTKYVDYLSTAADSAHEQARTSARWRVKKLRAKLIREAARDAVANLPIYEPDNTNVGTMPADDGKVITGHRTRIRNIGRKCFERIAKNGGDVREFAKLLADDVMRDAENFFAEANSSDTLDTAYMLSDVSDELSHKSTTHLLFSPDAERVVDALEIADSAGIEDAEGGQFHTPSSEENSMNTGIAAQDVCKTLAKSPLDFALEHARAGIPVFPVKRSDKRPLTRHGFKDATTDVQQIEAWARKYPDANWAMPTGGASGITVLDVDPRHGGDESLKRLLAEHGGFEATKVIKTGGGGLHFYFRHTPGLRNSASLLAPGLDIRADGGYVVIEGSIHASGGTYSVLYGEPEGEMPRWMNAKLVGAGTTAKPSSNARKTKWFGLSVVIPEGSRTDNLFRSVAAPMRGAGASQNEILAGLQEANARCSPPLPMNELVKMAASVTRRYQPNQ
jgi:hypothetical protein